MSSACQEESLDLIDSGISLRLPTADQWTDQGVVFREGGKGAWDRFLWGGFGMALVAPDSAYFLYYQGSSSYSTRLESVVGRAIGVAIQPRTQREFEKWKASPVLTWHPTCPSNDCEEGAVSVAPLLLDDGRIALYYGANTQETDQTVNADARLAVSADGLELVDAGVVLSHADNTVWGSGDELFPVCAIHHSGMTYLYYIPNGTFSARRLGVAWGSSLHHLPNSDKVVARGGSVEAWGAMSAVRAGADVYYLFVNNVPDAVTRAYVVRLDQPQRLEGPVEEYRFPESVQSIVFLDNSTESWIMIYRTADGQAYAMKTSPKRSLPVPSGGG